MNKSRTSVGLFKINDHLKYNLQGVVKPSSVNVWSVVLRGTVLHRLSDCLSLGSCSTNYWML